jgi:filamentous hemagglutinin family protein
MKVTLVLWLLIVLDILLLHSRRAWSQSYQPSERVPIADRTLGTTVLGSDGRFTIEGGVTRGQFLFHSFQDFSVPTNGSATFITPIGNQSTVVRVTGNSVSDINGTVNTQGANFFLLNLNGIVFGPQARLNVGAIFVASTANGLELGGSSGQTITFDRQGSGDAALLSVNPLVLFDPTRLNFTGKARAIQNFGNLQTTNSNQYIGLVGGDVWVEGGQINAPGGRVELGGLSAPGAVEFKIDRNAPKLLFPAGVARSDVVIQDNGTVNVAGDSSVEGLRQRGGEIGISARNFQVLSASRVRGGVEQNQGQVSNTSGNIEIDATNSITMGKDALLANVIRQNAKGQGGNVILKAADNIFIQDNALLGASNLGLGNAGFIDITAGNIISISGMGTVITGVGATGNSDSGGITITAGSFALTDQGFIATNNIGRGDAGAINIRTKQAILIAGNAEISAGISSATAQGNGGDIKLEAGHSVSLTNGSTISTENAGRGNGGAIHIRAGETITIADNQTRVLTIAGQGNGGNINIDAGRSLLFANEGLISTVSTTDSNGKSGNIRLAAQDTISMITGAVVISSQKGTGNSGVIQVQSDALLMDRSLISSINLGQGNGGNINLTVRDLRLVNRAGIGSALDKSPGRGGDIRVDSESLVLQGNSVINSTSAGVGTAGNIIVAATGSIDFRDRSGLISSALVNNGTAGDIFVTSPQINFSLSGLVAQAISGKGGNITVKASDRLVLRQSAFITTNSGQDGGNINVDAQLIAAISTAGNSQIRANATNGRGGNITINAQGVFGIAPQPLRFNSSTITASSDINLNGEIRINTPGIDPVKKTNELPTVPIDASQQIAQTCSPQQTSNNLYLTGRGGHPPNATDPGNSDVVWVDPRTPQSTKPQPPATPVLASTIQPAVGWSIDAQGQVSLLAAPAAPVIPKTPAACSTY